MKKVLTLSTVFAFVVTGALLLAVGFAAPKSSATSSLCHSTTLTIKAPTTARPGRTITVTGGLGRTPAHAVKATLQWKRATATTWKTGNSVNLTNGSYSLKWKAPTRKAKYKIRVRITHLSASRVSATKTVTVK